MSLTITGGVTLPHKDNQFLPSVIPLLLQVHSFNTLIRQLTAFVNQIAGWNLYLSLISSHYNHLHRSIYQYISMSDYQCWWSEVPNARQKESNTDDRW